MTLHDFVGEIVAKTTECPKHSPEYWEAYFKLMDFIVWRERSYRPLWKPEEKNDA